MVPVFLSLNEVVEIHRNQLARYGGDSGIRDVDLLKSAIGMPKATFGDQFLHAGICDMAAAYLFHLVRNHPFVDGNKRVGAVAMLVFLFMNGYEFNAPEDDFADMVMGVACGDIDKTDVAVFISRWARLSR